MLWFLRSPRQAAAVQHRCWRVRPAQLVRVWQWLAQHRVVLARQSARSVRAVPRVRNPVGTRQAVAAVEEVPQAPGLLARLALAGAARQNQVVLVAVAAQVRRRQPVAAGMQHGKQAQQVARLHAGQARRSPELAQGLPLLATPCDKWAVLAIAASKSLTIQSA